MAATTLPTTAIYLRRQGVNALDATVQGYTNVAMMRQQFKPSWRVHGVITDGGTEPNIIPAVSTSRWYIRWVHRRSASFIPMHTFN